mgnify:CR=1 FL=1
MALQIPEKWKVGDLGVYIFNFPYPKTEVINNTVVESPTTIRGDLTITLCVWGVSKENPLYIRLDGKTIKTITEEGYYIIKEKAIGSHHIAILCDYKVFEQAVFYAVPPPPPPPTMPLTEFYKRLEEQRKEVMTLMIFSTAFRYSMRHYDQKEDQDKDGLDSPNPSYIGILRISIHGRLLLLAQLCNQLCDDILSC